MKFNNVFRFILQQEHEMAQLEEAGEQPATEEVPPVEEKVQVERVWYVKFVLGRLYIHLKISLS